MSVDRLLIALVGLFLLAGLPMPHAWSAEPRVQILSPTDGSRITQDKNSVFVSGKVSRETGRSENVDIFLVIDVSGSTALYAGANLGDADQPPEPSSGLGAPQIFIG